MKGQVTPAKFKKGLEGPTFKEQNLINQNYELKEVDIRKCHVKKDKTGVKQQSRKDTKIDKLKRFKL